MALELNPMGTRSDARTCDDPLKRMMGGLRSYRFLAHCKNSSKYVDTVANTVMPSRATITSPMTTCRVRSR